MRKGKLGISLAFYAVLAFVFAFLQQTTLCLLLLGFVLVAERDEWASRQVIQATFLSLVATIVRNVFDVFDILDTVPGFSYHLSRILDIVLWIIYVLVLVCVIVALIKVAKGKDAGIPGLSTLADRAFGLVAQKVYATPPAGGQPQQPYPYNQAPQAPYQQPAQAPNGQPAQQPQQPTNQHPQQ